MIAKGESLEKLYEAIPKEKLPERYGGYMKDVDQSIWIKDLAKKAKQVSFKLFFGNFQNSLFEFLKNKIIYL